MDPVTVDIWSDVACPWCWLGYAHLQEAAAQAGIPVDVTFHAFQLSPDQSGTEPVATYLERKYGAGRMAGAQQRLQEMGARVGLEYDFDRALASNTFAAHRLHQFAQTQGRGKEVMEALFAAQHAHGADVSDPAVLEAVAEAQGLQGAKEVLASDAQADAVRQDIEAAKRLGIQGVPFFVLDRRVALSGAQPVDVFADALRKASPA